MTATVARLVLAMLLLPATGAVFMLVLLISVALNPNGPPSVASLLMLWLIVYLFIGGYWLLLWRGVVSWTPSRVRGTALGTLVSLACGAALGLGTVAANGEVPAQLAIMVGGGVVPILWVLVTVFVWRETTEERSQRLSAGTAAPIACPLCGYSLAGLREARCPECGTVFTLDQLLASQRDLRTAAEP